MATGDPHIVDLSGTKDGANVTFTIAHTPNLNSLLVVHNTNTLYRDASVAGKLRYSISGTTITLGIAPQSGADLWAFYEEA